MPSKALYSRAEALKTRKAALSALPLIVADLQGFELTSHCDRCGRHLKLYPGPSELHPHTSLTALMGRLTCTAQRNGEACRGRVRRLILQQDDHRWELDHTGDWIEQSAAFWEADDFAAVAQ